MIEAILRRHRALLSVLLFLVLTGVSSMINIAKEDSPDIEIPMVYVSVSYEGVDPKDADELLVKPIENRLRGISGVKKIESTATSGHASILIEFLSGVNIDNALQDVRQEVEDSEQDLPQEADTPSVNEINIGLFPVLAISIGGQGDERLLFNLSKDLQQKIEALPDVFEVRLAGVREEALDIIIDQSALDTLRISLDEVTNIFTKNNQVVTAGNVDNETGRFDIRVPGLIKEPNELLKMPIKHVGDRVIKLEDVGFLKEGFKDSTNISRFDGKPAFILEVSKRLGSNIIETIEKTKAVVEKETANWPEGIVINYSSDSSKNIKEMLIDLYNNVLSAMLLVILVILCVLGIRNAVLVGIAIPGSFLIAITALYYLGFTLNIVVLFSLILSVGMLVDGAIVITEYADRKLDEGKAPFEAYVLASKTLGWPVIASTLTTLAVFFPLLFWPGVIGGFMKFLPLTLIITLSASLLMALVMIPAIGLLTSKKRHPGVRISNNAVE